MSNNVQLRIGLNNNSTPKRLVIQWDEGSAFEVPMQQTDRPGRRLDAEIFEHAELLAVNRGRPNSYAQFLKNIS